MTPLELKAILIEVLTPIYNIIGAGIALGVIIFTVWLIVMPFVEGGRE